MPKENQYLQTRALPCTDEKQELPCRIVYRWMSLVRLILQSLNGLDNELQVSKLQEALEKVFLEESKFAYLYPGSISCKTSPSAGSLQGEAVSSRRCIRGISSRHLESYSALMMSNNRSGIALQHFNAVNKSPLRA